MKKQIPQHMRLLLITSVLFFSGLTSMVAQTGVLIAPTAGTADPSAMLEIRNANKGLLLPRVTLTTLSDNVNPVSNPVAGLFVYNTGGANPTGLYYWNGITNAWVQLTTGGFSGTGSGNYLARWTTSTNLGTGATYDDGTSVGIGTSSPVAKLELEGTSANWNEAIQGLTTGSIHLDPGSATDHFGSAITWGASDASAGDNAQAGIYVRSDGSYGTRMYFSTTDAYVTGSKTRMMINEAGNVGIGTTSLSVKFHVAGGGMILGTTGNAAAPRMLNILSDGQVQIGFGSYPGNWTSALQIQNNDNTRFLWLSPLDNASGGNARVVASGSGLDFFTGTNVNASPPLSLTASGYALAPNRPAFSVYLTAHWTTQSAVIVYTGVHVNNGNFYSASTGKFTAPVAGLYQFTFGGIKSTGSTAQVARMDLRRNGTILSPQARASEGAAYGWASATTVLFLNAGDVVDTWNTDLAGWYTQYTFFTGHLL